MKSKYTTDTITLAILEGASSGSISVTPEFGKVIGFQVITSGGANPGLVRCQVTDNNGQPLVKLVPVELLKNRQAGFNQSFYPISFEAKGQTLKFEIIATQNFTTALEADLVVIYDNDMCENY